MYSAYIETYGCAANQAESEIIAGILSKRGVLVTGNPDIADIIIINTCYVKQPTENKIIERIKKLKNKKLIITGCIPEANPERIRKIAPNASLVSTHHITKIPNIISKVVNNNRIELLGKTKIEKVCLPKIRRNKVIDIVPVCSGCLGNCSYCGTKISKGNLFSYPEEKIIKEIKLALKNGCKEIWLTGQEVSCYGFGKRNTNLTELLKKILDIEGKYYIRIGMLNPTHIYEQLNEFLDVCKDDRIFKFFHIPVQSGSDKILKDMNRNYSVDDFKQIVSKIRMKFKRCNLWTDVIVGYPTESDEDFEDTMNLLKEIKPDWTNISKFSTRKGTKAEKLKKLKSEVVKKRSIIASNIAKEISMEQNKIWDGWGGEILIDKINEGRNFAYKLIKIDSKELGRFVKVKVKCVRSQLYAVTKSS